MTDIRSLSEVLEDFSTSLHGEDVTLGNIFEAFHERGIGLLLLFFAAPMALPIPVPPGINIALATPLILLTLQQAYGAHTIWLPARTKRKSFNASKLKGVLEKIIPWLRRAELLTRPRLGKITQGPASQFFGILGFIMALSICIPVPLTNTVPSFGIALMAIGAGMRDGMAVLLGALIGTGWVVMICYAVLKYGPEAFEIIKETIKSLLSFMM